MYYFPLDFRVVYDPACFLTGSLTFIAHIFPLSVRNSDLLHSKHSDEWLNLTLPHIRGYYNHIWPQWTTSHAKSPTVICGHEESGVLVVVNVWRLAVQYGSGGDVAFEGVHDQPVCWGLSIHVNLKGTHDH